MILALQTCEMASPTTHSSGGWTAWAAARAWATGPAGALPVAAAVAAALVVGTRLGLSLIHI